MNSINYIGQKLSPSKVVCVGRNYVAHIEELNNEVPEQPVIFVKPNSAISNNLCANDKEPIHYEAEITFLVIKSQLHAVGLGLDLTKRETQSRLKQKGLPWERAKAFDGAALFSDFVPIPHSIEDLKMELRINEHIVQQASVNLMLNRPAKLLEEIESFMSFEDADLLMTGTPAGVGIVNRGDRFIGRIISQESVLIEHQWRVI